jgi:hypothetical protein
VLKSIWLEGKRNWRVDHLIHMLVVEFLPDLEMCHKWQELGMHGRDLAEQRRQQILRHAPETPLTQIRKINDLHFEVQSSNSNKSYNIDLVTTTCSCSDFPRIRLCKHIAAMVHFFGGADLGPQPLDNAGSASEPVAPCSPVQQDGSDDSTAVQTIINDIFSLLQGLVSKGPSDPRIANSLDLLNTIRSGLNKLVFPAGDSSYLPEKENIAPNQHSWLETAARMRVKRNNKCTNGKVDSALTAEHIGEPNRKRTADDDPYGAGEQSGKCAKPDAHSAAANVRARIAEERQAAPKAEPLPSLPASLPPLTSFPPPASFPLPASSPLPASLPLPAFLPPPASLPLPASLPPPTSLPLPVSLPLPSSYTPTLSTHAPGTYSYYPHPPMSQPIFSQSQGVPMAPPYFPPYAFLTYSYPPQM